MAVCADGHLQGWGHSSTTSLLGVANSTTNGPVWVHPGILNRVVAVELGNECAFALDGCGFLYAWGNNNEGQLGVGASAGNFVLSPTLVVFPTPQRVVSVSAGESFTLAVCADGSLWAWGRNTEGQLGTGSAGPAQFTPVSTLLTAGIKKARCGKTFAVALRTTGQVLTWGDNHFGQLGQNLPLAAVSLQPTTLTTLPGPAVDIETAGRYTGGAVLANGAVYCWGYNIEGQLGNGNTTDQPGPVQALFPGGGAIALAGNSFGFMATSSTGQTHIWGSGYGQFLGLCGGPATSYNAVAGPTFAPGTTIIGVATSAFEAIAPNGDVLYWGCGGLPYNLPGGSGTAACGCSPTLLPNAYPAVPNTTPLPAVVPVTLNTTAVTLCAGSSTVLQAQGGDGIHYRWSPDIGLSVRNGATVVVAPNQSQTYTVTSTNACGTATATVAVTVNENCCQANDGYGIALQGTYNTSPFVGAPGARYLGTSDLLLLNDVFTLGLGQTLLMKPNTTITVSDGAELRLNGATITASCDEMWGGIVVTGRAAGLFTSGVGSIRSRIQHAVQGVNVQEGGPARFQLRSTDFLHNQTGLALHRRAGGATSQDFVRSCTFDSDPAFFKSPWAMQSPTDYHYTQHHLYLAGNLQPATFVRNKLRHAIFGMVGSDIDGEASNIEFDEGEVTDCYLAGAYNSINPGYRSTWSFDGTLFRLPGGAALPDIPQIRDYLPLVSSDGLREESYGIWTRNEAAARVLSCTFAAADDAPARQAGTYDEFGRTGPRHVGIHTYNLMTVEGSRFETLETGIDQWAYPYSRSTLLGNVFENCRIGWDILAPGDVFAADPSPPEPLLNATCNNFARGAFPDGTATGIHVRQFGILYSIPTGGYFYQYPTVKLEDPSGAPLKNIFDNAGRGPGEFFAVNNEQGGNPITYFTYHDTSADPNFESTVLSYSNGIVRVSPNSTFPTSGGATVACNLIPGVPAGVGVQLRGPGPGAGGGASPLSATSLSANWPNPCTTATAFTYHLKPGANAAALLVQRAVDGREVQRLPLALAGSAAEVNTSEWAAGTYLVTLLVNGERGPTRRVVVGQH